MADQERARGMRRFRFAILAVVVLGLFFVHVWTQINPRLIYHLQSPVYFLDWRFFEEHLDRPGRLVEYAWAFLTQFHYLGWPGAVVLTAVAGCTVLATRSLLVRMGRPNDVVPVVPAILLVVLYNHYEHPLTTSIGLVAALVTTLVYVQAAPQRLWKRAILFLVLALVLYYAAGGPMFLFSVLAALHEVLAVGRRRPSPQERLLGLVYLAAAAAVPYVAMRWLFVIEPTEAFVAHLPFWIVQDAASLAASIGLYALFPLAAAWSALWPRGPDETETPTPTWFGGRAAVWLQRSTVAWVLASVVLLTAGTLVALGSADDRTRSLLLMDYCSANGRWEEVLAEASRLPRTDSITRQSITRALYHTGRLLEDAFGYPQGDDVPPPPSLALFYANSAYDRQSETLLLLGRVNEAEHMAYEALELVGSQPQTLRRLVLINVLKGQPEAAKVFLGRLEKTLWHRAWARRCRSDLEADSALSATREVRRLRPLMVTADSIDTSRALQGLLQANPGNRMAFEYFMFYHLVQGKSVRLLEELGRITHLDYPRLPRHLQEAVLHGMLVTHRTQVNLHGHHIPPETVARHREFIERLTPHLRARNPQAAWDALKDDFGDTFWFYYTFRCTPHGRSGPPATASKARTP